MSHSYKKLPVLKQHNDAYYKRLCHTRNRMLLRIGFYDTSNRMYKLKVGRWDICDWRSRFFNQRRASWMRWTEEDIQKAIRK